jgi:DNA recombination protein RmuC
MISDGVFGIGFVLLVFVLACFVYAVLRLMRQVATLSAALGRVDDNVGGIQQAWHGMDRLLSARHDDHIKQFSQLQMHQQQVAQGGQKAVQEALHKQNEVLNQQVHLLIQSMTQQLQHISGMVDKRLHEGFDKTNDLFTDVVKRLALIDQAQKRIQDLSHSVVDLQNIFQDKRAQGVFGEVQLSALVRNVMPEKHFALQHTLTNGKRADCALFLPDPTGMLVIDAKFPLESHQNMVKSDSAVDGKNHTRLFKQAMKKHIKDIADKYIISGETADAAMMFIPAESVFSDLHSAHPDVVAFAQNMRVWLVSPNTMMAILTTALAVIKDVATRQQVHHIQKHLKLLHVDFGRFQKRMQQLAKHIAMAHKDVDDVHVSAHKIAQNFEKIERVELDALSEPADEGASH